MRLPDIDDSSCNKYIDSVKKSVKRASSVVRDKQ